jgi:HTH-type transcriptional regulator/antitoxin HigA
MSGRIKPIKNDIDYDEALVLMEKLVTQDPAPNTEKADQISILATLIENYERSHFPLDIPSAIDAIRFRMDQLDLKSVDLVQYLGSTSRVSEILSGKRSLTVDMINALSAGLGIPEKALLKKEVDENEYSRNIPTPVFKQMMSRGYFNVDGDKPTLLQGFFSKSSLSPSLLYRRSKLRTDGNASQYVLVAWADRVLERAKRIKAGRIYIDGTIDLEYMRNIAKYSVDEKNGVKNAITKLLEDGIKIVIEPALQGTKLDGAAIFEDKNNPIIALTLRYDRLDNFWFTIMHELAHIAKHRNLDKTFIYDNLDAKGEQVDDIEKEADAMASEALVNNAKWLVSAARMIPSPLAAMALANELGVHMAIIAGKARYESGNWKYLASTVSKFTIRDKFKEVKW